jgi:hypothetical protein
MIPCFNLSSIKLALPQPEVPLLGRCREDDVRKPLDFASGKRVGIVALKTGGPIPIAAGDGHQAVPPNPLVLSEKLLDLSERDLELVRSCGKRGQVIPLAGIDNSTDLCQV